MPQALLALKVYESIFIGFIFSISCFKMLHSLHCHSLWWSFQPSPLSSTLTHLVKSTLSSLLYCSFLWNNWASPSLGKGSPARHSLSLTLLVSLTLSILSSNPLQPGPCEHYPVLILSDHFFQRELSTDIPGHPTPDGKSRRKGSAPGETGEIKLFLF